MNLKSASLATRLLLTSCVSAVVVVAAIVSFIKFSIIPQMTEQALVNQTSTLAHALRGARGSDAMWQPAELGRPDTLDGFSSQGKIVATLFLAKDGRYFRAATTLKKEDGSRAIGTELEPNSEAAKALRAGHEYSGHMMLFNRLHMTTYLPVALANGVMGAVFVGIDYGSADPMLLLAKQMDYMVLAVGAAAVLLLGVGMYFSVRVEARHRETEDIFRTTQEGIFLIDHDLRVGSQTSQALSRLLGFAVQPGENFLEMIRASVSPKTFETAKEYLELLLRHEVKEKLVASLNPLDCIEVSAVGPSGAIDTRFLQISFNRVVKSGKVTHLLGTANNITRQVRLERELKESERKVQDQMAMMVHILQADPRLLQEFLVHAGEGLSRINEEIRTSSQTTGLSDAQIDTAFRLAHQLKGDASALQLETFTQALHGLETLLGGLRESAQRKGEALLPVTVRMKEIFSEIASIQEVMARISQLRGVVTVEPPRPAADESVAQQPLVRQWAAFAHQLAEQHGKKVDLVYQGLDLEQLGGKQHEAINSVVNQFIRNALVHGVESPAERKQRGKPEAARLSVYVSDLSDGFIELSFRDDGAGINLEKVRAAALRSGRHTPESLAKMDARGLTMLIFEPGLSTRAQADTDAGRGIGLDAVREIVGRQGGRMRIGSTPGEYCHFRVQLPQLRRREAPTIEPAAETVKSSTEVA